MKQLLPFIICFCSLIVKAQDSTWVENDSILHTHSGFIIKQGDYIKLGNGTLPDGDFKFISKNTQSLFYGSSDNRSLQNGYNALPRSQSGMKYKIIRIDTRGNKRHGYVIFPIINVGMTRFQIQIDEAIASGEIIVPDEFKPKQLTQNSNSEDVYDKIKKLKELLDAGALTQEEYDAQKKKLLDKD